MSNFIKNNFSNSLITEFLFVFIILIFFLNYFIPIDYEPSGECFNEWAAARMLLDGDGFPVSYLPLGYTLYSSIIMYFFDYTSFVVVEYFLTFLYFFFCMYFCLKVFLNKYASLLVCVIFIPTIIVLEGHNTIIGCAIFFIYMKNMFLKKNNTFFSLTLFFAFMFHSVYLPFLIGHSFGYLLPKENRTYLIQSFKFKSISILNLKNLTIILLFILNFLAFIYKSERPDNNYFMSKETWSPVELNSPLEIGVFQITPYYYSILNTEKKNLYNSDWYFLAPKVFQGSKTLKEVFFKTPEILMSNAITNIKNFIYLPNSLLFQWNLKLLTVLSCIIFIFAFCNTIIWTRKNNLYTYLSSLLIGQSALAFVLALTWSHNLRYNIIFFPIYIPLIFLLINNFNRYLKSKLNINYFFIFLLVVSASLFSYNKNVIYNGIKISFFKPASGFSKHFNLIKENVNKNDIIVTPYQQWVKGFLGVNHENVIPFTELPPFKNIELSNKILNKASQIWISPKMIKPQILSGHNYHIRYDFHIDTFLENKNYEIINIGKLGKILKIKK